MHIYFMLQHQSTHFIICSQSKGEIHIFLMFLSFYVFTQLTLCGSLNSKPMNFLVGKISCYILC